MYKYVYENDLPPDGTWDGDPGANEKLWINLNSQLFDRPMGLAFYMINQDYEPYGAFYAEDCYLDNHQIVVRAGAIILTESATIQFDRILPISMQVPVG